MKFGLIVSKQHPRGVSMVERFREHVDQVRAARDNGLHSVWVSQHYLTTPFQMLQQMSLLGRIAAPLKANAIRINDNIATFLNNVIGITKDVKGTIVWAADEVVYAPEVAVTGVRVDEIAGFMEELD